MAHILVIDDNADIVELIKKLLIKEGHIVTSAPDGQLGLVAIKRDRPDLIVLDLNLPKVHGHDVCKNIKADPTTQRIPVVMLTAAYTSSEDAKHGLNLGADEYVVKPFMHVPFLATVQRLLGQGPGKA